MEEKKEKGGGEVGERKEKGGGEVGERKEGRREGGRWKRGREEKEDYQVR